MKMLPKDYAKAVGEPFRTESYKGAVLEMYYLNDREDFHKFASRGRFSIWTSNGIDYRLFVEKGYYEAVSDLYLNEVNDIWLDFTNSIYGAQKKMSRMYMTISMIVLLVVLGVSMLLQQVLPPEMASNVFLGAMVVLFIGLFVSSNMQQKKLRKLVSDENKNATQLIKDALGDEKFQNILDGQEKYYAAYYNTESPEVEEASTEETLEIDTDTSEGEETDTLDKE